VRKYLLHSIVIIARMVEVILIDRDVKK